MLVVLFIFSLSSALITLYPPASLGLDPIPGGIIEADFCTAPPRLTNVSLVYIENTLGPCDNIVIPSNISVADKIVYTPVSSCPDCCALPYLVQALQQAGAIGFLSDTNVGLKQTAAQTTQKGIFCYALTSPASFDVIDWLTTGDVTADVFQPSMSPAQRDALLDIQSQTPSPVWDRNLDPCSSTLDVPPSRVPWQGVTCDVNGVLTQLVLPFPIGPTGRLPDSFCGLTTLTALTIQEDTSFNRFQFCSNLTKLINLKISGTSLNQIDDRVFGARYLSLELSNNQLTGPLNFSKWHVQTRQVNLRGNFLNGTLAGLTRLANLLILNLAQNRFTGQIPDFSLLSKLLNLDLSDNQFTSVTPLSQNSLITAFRLSYNLLTEINPGFLSKLSAVPALYLDHNQLAVIPNISTEVPWVALLDISSNRISGLVDIVTEVMATCLASNNKITGISSVLSTGYDNLAQLDLSNNSLSGVLSLPFKRLHDLSVANNKITTFDFSLQLELSSADFSNNQLFGDLSNAVKIQQKLVSLDLTNNSLTGIVPNSFFSALVQLRLTGNPGLNHGASSLLPARVVFTWTISQTFESMRMECPTYSVQDVLRSVFTIDPSYHDNKLCRCLVNFYRKPGMTYCSPCLPNAVCPGKEDPLSVENNANILANFGYFPLPNPEDPQMFVPCRFGVVLPNDPLNPCNPRLSELVSESQDEGRNTSVAATRFQCSVGYTDRLCSRCEPGWFRKEGRCLICNGRPEYPLFLIAIVCIFLGACTFFAYRQPVDMSTTSINPDGWTFEPKQRVYDFVPLILHFFQVSTIILVKLQSLDVVQTMNSLLVTASFSTPQSGIGFECGLPVFQGFVTQYLAVIIFPPILAVVLAGFFGVRILVIYYKGGTQVWNLHLYQYLYGLFSMFEAIHFPLVTYVLGVFQCTKDPISGISYFTDHPYLLCSSISPAGKVFPLLLYPIGLVGFFVCLGVYLHYAPSDVKESEPIIQSFAFFYIRFKPDRVASGVFFIFLNLGLSLVVGLMEPNSDVFPTLIVLLLIMDFFFVTVFQPYLQPRYNKVRTVNDLVALLLFVNNLIYSSGDQFPGRSASPAVIYVGLNLGMIAFYTYHLYRIVKIHRTDLRLMRANSGVVDPLHRGDGRKHIELGELKSRKHTNIDPPSTSHGETPTHGKGSATSHVYVPVTTNPPASATDTGEGSAHSPLPIISEHESTEFGVNPKAKDNSSSGGGGLVFTENPLAETGTTFSGETPPSPSSKE